jgi:hypothetical protein
MLVFHWSRFSPLNFCSSERIVSDGMPEDIVGKVAVYYFDGLNLRFVMLDLFRQRGP